MHLWVLKTEILTLYLNNNTSLGGYNIILSHSKTQHKSNYNRVNIFRNITHGKILTNQDSSPIVNIHSSSQLWQRGTFSQRLVLFFLNPAFELFWFQDSEQQMILTARRSLVQKMARHQTPQIEIFFLNISGD